MYNQNKTTNKRGKYKRDECRFKGRVRKGHYYKKITTETVIFPDHTEIQTYKVCECGHKKSLKTDTETRPRGTVTGEVCRNPWKPSCKNTNITNSIMYKGELHPICVQCWEEISKSDREWGE